MWEQTFFELIAFIEPGGIIDMSVSEEELKVCREELERCGIDITPTILVPETFELRFGAISKDRRRVRFRCNPNSKKQNNPNLV